MRCWLLQGYQVLAELNKQFKLHSFTYLVNRQYLCVQCLVIFLVLVNYSISKIQKSILLIYFVKYTRGAMSGRYYLNYLWLKKLTCLLQKIAGAAHNTPPHGQALLDLRLAYEETIDVKTFRCINFTISQKVVWISKWFLQI